MFEHKLEKHPEGPMDSNPNKTTVKEMVLNLLAEQGMEILEEFQDFKKNLRDAFEHFTEEIKDNMIDITNTAVKNITSNISILAKESPIPATKP